jgi:hypothetical protein
MTPSLSLNEIEALALKATRGAGLDWGLAEEAAFAVRWLCQHGVDGNALLLAYLDERADTAAPMGRPVMTGRSWAAEGYLCPLMAGAALSDFAKLPEGPIHSALTLERLALPALILPFLSALVAHHDLVLQVGWSRSHAVLGPNRLFAWQGDDIGIAVADVTIAPLAVQVLCAGRPEPDEAAIVVQSRLLVYGAKTYVPASDASRKGAGAADDG